MKLRLFHLPISPFGRKLRLALFEKELLADIEALEPWAMDGDLTAKNPAQTLPILEVDGDVFISPSSAICEFLEEAENAAPLWPAKPLDRAEARRLTAWFDEKFHREVTELILYEKVHKRLKRTGHPDMGRIRAGLHNIRIHLDYISYLADRRRWLAGDGLTYADLAAAGHLSAIDYCGDVPWEDYPAAKDWYMRMKSRPSFRSLLTDRVPGMPPVKHYDDLDF
jgi:glutathione S-transferase